MCVNVHSTSACTVMHHNPEAWACTPQLVLNQLPLCPAHVVHLRHVDAYTSSWHQHAPNPESQDLQSLPYTNASVCPSPSPLPTPTRPVSPVSLNAARDTNNTILLPLFSNHVGNSTTRGQASSRNPTCKRTIPERQRSIQQRSSRPKRFLKRIKSSSRKTTEAVSLGLEVSP